MSTKNLKIFTVFLISLLFFSFFAVSVEAGRTIQKHKQHTPNLVNTIVDNVFSLARIGPPSTLQSAQPNILNECPDSPFYMISPTSIFPPLEIWNGTQEIQWGGATNIPNVLLVISSVEDGVVLELTTDNDGSYFWDTTTVPDNQYVINIILSVTCNGFDWNLSNNGMVIVHNSEGSPPPPECDTVPLILVSPTVGDVLSGTHEIQWCGVSHVPGVSLKITDIDIEPVDPDCEFPQICPQDITETVVLDIGTANDGSYMWDTTTGNDGNGYFLELKAVMNTSCGIVQQTVNSYEFSVNNMAQIPPNPLQDAY